MAVDQSVENAVGTGTLNSIEVTPASASSDAKPSEPTGIDDIAHAPTEAAMPESKAGLEPDHSHDPQMLTIEESRAIRAENQAGHRGRTSQPRAGARNGAAEE